jgi:hypothetical protein
VVAKRIHWRGVYVLCQYIDTAGTL